MKVSLIIAAAGKGLRAGFEKNKLLVKTDGKTCLERTLEAFTRSGLIDEYIIVCSKTDEREILPLLPCGAVIARGGETRTQSVKNALEKVTGDVVLIHDGARPFVTEEIIKNCIDDAAKYGGTIAAVPSRDTVCAAKDGTVKNYVGKPGLYSVQTPQAFKTALIRRAYSLSGERVFNDDGEVYLNFIGELHISQGSAANVKLTYPEDFRAESGKIFRCGTGFDCHKLVENRKLILGGVEIPHDKGLLGHSDADVLAHAVMDALLSAAAMRDIGYHFPDSEQKYKDADSMSLLKRVLKIIGEKGYKPYNVSAVIMAEKPKLSAHIQKITVNLATALGLPAERVGIGATTLEGLGFVGREEGICVRATATVTD